MGKSLGKNKLILALAMAAVMVLIAGAACGAVPGEAEMFEEAHDHYLSSNPGKAVELFDMFLRTYPGSSARDAALFWKAKSLAQLRKTEEAVKVFAEIEAHFPESGFNSFALKELEGLRRAPTKISTAKEETGPVKGPMTKNCEENLRKSEEDRKVLENKMSDVFLGNQVLAQRLAELVKETEALETSLAAANKKQLFIFDLIRKRILEDVTEEDIKNYYESNKAEYLVRSGEKIARSLIISHTGVDEIEKALFAAEIHNEAVNGKPFEEIYKSQPGQLMLTEGGYAEFPSWLREKAERLRNGEISNIISLDDSFIILQPRTVEPIYRKFEEVKAEIREKLICRNTSGDRLGKWLEEIRREAEKAR